MKQNDVRIRVNIPDTFFLPCVVNEVFRDWWHAADTK